jgi:serine/threonine-protein kinase
VQEARAALMAAHKEILFWEGRSAFQEPYQGLREAYIVAAAEVAAWISARKVEKAAQERAEGRDREVLDLEFQIQELRAALAKLEHSVDAEQAEGQKRIAELDKRTEALQVELLAIATRFCAPLRRRPELSSLFQELEADASA